MVMIPKRMEGALRESEQQFRLMVDGARDYAIVILDTKGRIKSWNEGAARLTGYPAKVILGKYFSCLHTSEDVISRKAERMLSAAIAKGRAEDEAWRVRRDGSRYWANVVLTALRDEEGGLTGFCKVTRNMTERKEFERREMGVQKRELATQIARGIAHRFNNLMCSVTVGAEMLLLRPGSVEELRPLVENMKMSAHRAAKLTTQLLTFSQNLVSQRQWINLTVMLQHVESSLQDTLGKQIRLRMVLDSGTLGINADPAQLEIMLFNLASNARDAMPDGGDFTVELGRVATDELFFKRHPELPAGEYVCLSLRDTGCGMSDEIIARAVEPFYTTKDPQRDGLGLAICHSIVKHNGGQMGITSKVGRGTEIEIIFPLASATDAEQVSEAMNLPTGKENILLVDDETPLRRMTAASLRDLGYQVTEASNGQEAIKLVHESTLPEIHALITDGRMPNMGGRPLAREVHALHPKAKVLFISGYPSAPDELSVLPELDASVLQKPFSLSTLAWSLRKLLDA